MDKVEDFALFRSFVPWHNISPRDVYNMDVERAGIFRNFLSIDLRGDVFEVPSIYTKLAMECKFKGYDRLVIPLFVGSDYIRPVSMAGSILDYLGKTGWSERLRGVRTSKGEIYYGCSGLILDKDFKPLFVATFTISYTDSMFEIQQANCRIPHRVFSIQEDILPKTIYKKFIPLYGTTPINVSLGLPEYLRNSQVQKQVEIKIGIGANIVFSSNVPKPSDATDEEFRSIIRDNIESFI